ncbi:hypothetical protein MXB_5416 [Myxobolus squamalis]|nr:hypothetical protein MXB_5416 [Myxobolus squamalis]
MNEPSVAKLLILLNKLVNNQVIDAERAIEEYTCICLL